jgi:Glyoxalase-like domain
MCAAPAYRLDHVVLAVRDLEGSAARLREEHGLRFVPGGRHPRWGTANMIAPLGADYLELLAVVDEEVGSRTVLGRTLLQLSTDGDRWFSVCLADDDLERTAERLALTIQPGSRTRPDGTELRWRGAGIEERGNELWLPFFIDWDVPPALHPGAAPVDHRVPLTGIARAEVGGDEARLDEWLGGRDAPIQVLPGAEPGVRAVAIEIADGGEIVLRS